MANVQLALDEGGKGTFYINEANDRIAEMDIEINQAALTVYHTEVSPEYEHQGLAKKMLDHMAHYARMHNLMILPLCTFVLTQFKHNPGLYKDIWKG